MRRLCPVPRRAPRRTRAGASAGGRLWGAGRRWASAGYSTSASGAVEASDDGARGGDGRASRRPTWEERLLQPAAPSEATLRDTAVQDIVAALTAMRDRRGWSFRGQDIDRHKRIVQLVRHLVGPRGQPLGAFAYECMMDAMADPQGSVLGMRRLLADLRSQGMAPTAALCQAALAALANHPDYGLRQEMLDTMDRSWFAADQDDKQHVVVGLLRDEQYELAYTRLSKMIEQGAAVAPWVYDTFILAFGKLGFLDEMVLLLQRRRGLGAADAVATSLVYYALDVCSRAFHRQGTALGWKAAVRSAAVRPADGVVDNVLATAARHGDAGLATEALEVLSQRGRVQAHHYEAAGEAFAAGDDVAGALRIACIMKRTGARMGREHTAALRAAVKRRAGAVGEAEAALRALGEAEERVPLAAAAAVVEATAEAQGSERAMALYGETERLCREAAEATTLQALLVHSRSEGLRRALARELRGRADAHGRLAAAAEEPGRLAAACAEAGELELALGFAAQALARAGPGGEARVGRGQLGWVRPLVACAAARGDGRVWRVLDEVERRGDEGARAMVGMLLQQQRLARRAASWAGGGEEAAEEPEAAAPVGRDPGSAQGARAGAADGGETGGRGH